MMRLTNCRIALALALALTTSSVAVAEGVPDVEVGGEKLAYWVEMAGREDGPEDLAATVAALAEAVQMESPEVKVAAADALALLGADAKAAMPALTGQLGHVHPWVRVAAMGALASMGKTAVPTLAAMVRDEEGGPRIRAAFILAGMGADAMDAVPILDAVMQAESDVMKPRFYGILSSIDPQNYPPRSTIKQAEFDATAAGSDLAATGLPADWPHFRGPRCDGICLETGLLHEWPEETGPLRLWKIEGLGEGYSSLAITDGRILTMGDRGEGDARRQEVIALDLQTQAELWATPIGPPHDDGGPRCTPTVDADRVYAIGTEGEIACLETATGKILWTRNMVEDFGGAMMSGWKYSESPLIDGDKVICTPGAADAAVVALDKQTGDVLWKCGLPDIGEKGADGAGYCSVVVAEIAGTRQYVQLLGRGVIGIDAATGELLWSYNRVANNVANIPTPVVRGDYVFVSTAYNVGSALLKIVAADDGFEAQEVYFITARDFCNHHGGVVRVGDYLYGGHGSNSGHPTCVDFATGEVVWKERSPARGSAAVLYADGHLIFRYDRGGVALIEATPEEMRVKGLFDAPLDEGPAWAHPVIFEGWLYLRHADILLCYDLRAL